MEFSWTFADTDKLIRQIKEMQNQDELRRVAAVLAQRLNAVGVRARFNPSADISQMSNEQILESIEQLAGELRRRQAKP